MIGKTISHYKILEKLGEGGMGVVYKAEDTRLKRTVALKFLSSHTLVDEEDKARFLHEAQSAAALRHPGICTVYEIDEAEGRTFIVMEYIEGQSLKNKIESGPLEVEEAVDILTQIAGALKEAHEKQIVHRDIKPANIMITDKGQTVVMDFGLAKSAQATQVTKPGTTLGTVAYMSPEQAMGDDVDHRTDIWSLGVLLYQMVTGQVPFKGEFEHAVIYSILNTEPEAPTNIRKDLPADLERIILRTLDKDRNRRYASMRELYDALVPFRGDSFSGTPSREKAPYFIRNFKRPALLIPAALLIVFLGFLLIRYVLHNRKVQWARKEVLPEIVQHVENDKYYEAFQLAQEAREIIPSDPLLVSLWPEITTTVSIHTTPPGAGAYMKDYREPESEWKYLGQTPIDSLVVPKGFFRWNIRKEEYEPVEAAGSARDNILQFVLEKLGTIPEGMVKIPGGKKRAFVGPTSRFETIDVADFLMDKFEVTNEFYKVFVDSGGYQRREFWKNDFLKDGRVLSWEEGMEFFKDATGRAGPATWELGAYLEGQEDYPVTGISWYEAAAYAEFAGKSLPTVHHWIYSASISASAHIVPQSNFGGKGLAPVGSFFGISYYGIEDMAGNAREWCFNSTGTQRFTLGGCWSDPHYMFNFTETRSAFDRSSGTGFRCVKYLGKDSTLEAAQQNVNVEPPRNYNEEKPVSDEILEAYLNMYSYDKTPLNATIDFMNEKPEHWKIEKISFDAAYGNERMFIYLFLPKDVSPPYQTIILFPGAHALEMRSSGGGNDLNSFDAVDFMIKSGRAVVCPIYQSTYERDDGYNLYDPNTTETSHREHIIMWWKDLSRSLDYLETRKDIDHDKLGYCGSSWGAWLAPLFLAQDKRYKIAFLRLGGFPTFEMNASIDPINFAPRIEIPVLMLNGKYDYIFPYETSQLPMFNALVTPPEHKRHVIFEAAHSVYGHRNEMIREALDWLDRYLGPVR